MAKKSSIKNDDYTKYVYDAFDIQNKEETEVEVFYGLKEGKTYFMERLNG